MLRKANLRDVPAKALGIQAILRAPALRQPPAVQQAFAAIVAGEVRLIEALNAEIDALGEVVAQHFGRHPDADLYTSQPGLGVILGARVLAEFGDDPDRFADAKARKNYSGMSPITKASGTKRVVLARFARNRRLGDALLLQAFAALNNSPGARAFYDRQRDRGATHYQALRALANRLVGILHGCLRTHNLYDEHLAWHTEPDKLSSAA